jgi:hypothetical protein
MTITRSEFVCTTHLAKTFSGVQTKIKCLADKKIPQEKSQKFSVLQTKKNPRYITNMSDSVV